MENTKEIIDWSIENSEALNLKAEFYVGMQKYLKGIFDVGIYIEANNKEYYGRGCDFNESKAYVKALSEAFERASLNVFGFENTNGLAVHSSLAEAKKNAKNEILERDAFLCKYLLNSGFEKTSPVLPEALEILKREGVSTSFYTMCMNDDGYGVLCLAEGHNYKNPFGCIMGTSYEKNFDQAKVKSFLEMLKQVVHFQKGESIAMSEKDFAKLNDVNFQDHGRLGLDLKYSKNFIMKLNNHSLDVSYEENGCFEYNLFNLKKVVNIDVPLVLVRASNKELQGLYTGQTLEKNINMKRLEKIKKAISFEEINLIPHPFD